MTQRGRRSDLAWPRLGGRGARPGNAGAAVPGPWLDRFFVAAERVPRRRPHAGATRLCALGAKPLLSRRVPGGCCGRAPSLLPRVWADGPVGHCPGFPRQPSYHVLELPRPAEMSGRCNWAFPTRLYCHLAVRAVSQFTAAFECLVARGRRRGAIQVAYRPMWARGNGQHESWVPRCGLHGPSAALQGPANTSALKEAQSGGCEPGAGQAAGAARRRAAPGLGPIGLAAVRPGAVTVPMH